MSNAAEQCIAAALTLSVQERAKVIGELIRSLDQHDAHPADQGGIDAAWVEVIARRIREVENGEVELVDGDEIYRQLRSGTRG